MDCVLLGYAFHSVGYRFLVVKSEVSDVYVGTIMETKDANFLEEIFPMKDMPSSSNQEIPNTSSQELAVIPDPTISIEHTDNPVLSQELLHKQLMHSLKQEATLHILGL